jgi:hypothetical protein
MKKPIILVYIISILSSTNGQTISHSNNIWLHYVGKTMLTQKLSFTLEASMRYTDWGNQNQQWFVRPSLDYQFTKHFTGSIGYTHYKTYSYGSPAMFKTSIPEDHLWLQGTFSHQLGKFRMTNRLRDENRLVGIPDAGTLDSNTGQRTYVIDHYQYRNRFRYMLLFSYPLMKRENETVLFCVFGDEAFLNIGTVSGATLFNQNRVIAGVGYNFNKSHQVQVNYIHQNIWNYTNTIIESNPTIRLSYINNFSLAKKRETIKK